MNPLLDPSRRLVIAHRGASAERPENTLEAFRVGLEQGADALELDVRLTRDGHAVVVHDPTLRRTALLPGQVARLTLAEVRRADAGAGYTDDSGGQPWAGRGVQIPTLAEVLEAFPAAPLLIEIKAREAQEAVARALERSGAAARCVIASFKARALDRLRRPPFLIGNDRTDVARHYLRTRLGLPGRTPRCVCFAVPWRWKGWLEVPRPRFIAEAGRHGRPVHVWTVDDPAVAKELWRRGANGLITNRPGLIRTLAASLR